MGSLSYDCPHCGTKQAYFRTFQSHPEAQDKLISLHAECAICKRGVVFHLFQVGNVVSDVMKAGPGDFGSNYGQFQINRTSPVAPKAAHIEALPDEVRRPFDEAEATFAARNFSSAAVMYRKAIERTVKAKHPDGNGMLNQRIRALEQKNALPHSMIELLDMVKFLGNDGAHDEDDPTEDEVRRGRDFAHLLLTYLWALPKQIEDARAARRRS